MHHGRVRLFRRSLVLALALSLTPVAWTNARPATHRTTTLRTDGASAWSVSRLDARTRTMMKGSSWRPGCPVPMSDLRLVKVAFHGFDGDRHRGKLVVHRRFAREMVHVFRKLWRTGFHIRRMRLVDAYGADDKVSMAHDNTSAFNCRWRNGVCCTWSQHAYGKAIDINPVENPYVGSWGVSPPSGRAYLDRSDRRRGMILFHDRVWWAFHYVGWSWGGTWTASKDYQHFSANGR